MSPEDSLVAALKFNFSARTGIPVYSMGELRSQGSAWLAGEAERVASGLSRYLGAALKPVAVGVASIEENARDMPLDAGIRGLLAAVSDASENEVFNIYKVRSNDMLIVTKGYIDDLFAGKRCGAEHMIGVSPFEAAYVLRRRGVYVLLHGDVVGATGAARPFVYFHFPSDRPYSAYIVFMLAEDWREPDNVRVPIENIDLFADNPPCSRVPYFTCVWLINGWDVMTDYVKRHAGAPDAWLLFMNSDYLLSTLKAETAGYVEYVSSTCGTINRMHVFIMPEGYRQVIWSRNVLVGSGESLGLGPTAFSYAGDLHLMMGSEATLEARNDLAQVVDEIIHIMAPEALWRIVGHYSLSRTSIAGYSVLILSEAGPPTLEYSALLERENYAGVAAALESLLYRMDVDFGSVGTMWTLQWLGKLELDIPQPILIVEASAGAEEIALAIAASADVPFADMVVMERIEEAAKSASVRRMAGNLIATNVASVLEVIADQISSSLFNVEPPRVAPTEKRSVYSHTSRTIYIAVDNYLTRAFSDCMSVGRLDLRKAEAAAADLLYDFMRLLATHVVFMRAVRETGSEERALELLGDESEYRRRLEPVLEAIINYIESGESIAAISKYLEGVAIYNVTPGENARTVTVAVLSCLVPMTQVEVDPASMVMESSSMYATLLAAAAVAVSYYRELLSREYRSADELASTIVGYVRELVEDPEHYLDPVMRPPDLKTAAVLGVILAGCVASHRVPGGGCGGFLSALERLMESSPPAVEVETAIRDALEFFRKAYEGMVASFAGLPLPEIEARLVELPMAAVTFMGVLVVDLLQYLIELYYAYTRPSR